VLLLIGGASVVVGFIVSFLFLLFTLLQEHHHGRTKVLTGSLAGASLIAVTTFLSLVTVSGLGILSNVNLTGFSIMSFVLSVGFAVEYSVHIVARWLRADTDLTTSLDRVEYTMSFLTLPTFMSFASSTIGVACLAGTDFEFNEVFFFRPLIIVMFVTYFYGCWWLPALLTLLDFDAVKLGHLNNSVPPIIAGVDGDKGAIRSSQKESEDAVAI
jgi:predicted RND superfamily exporter protein